MTPYELGHTAALESLGLTKEAVSVLAKPKFLARAGRWIAKKRPLNWMKELSIGQPRRFGREVMQGKALSKGSLVRQSLHAPDMFSKAMFYGFPAVESGGILMDDAPNKAKRIGQSLGGAALGLAAWKPLGMIGAIGADMIGRGVGGTIGQTVGHLAPSASKSRGQWQTQQGKSVLPQNMGRHVKNVGAVRQRIMNPAGINPYG